MDAKDTFIRKLAEALGDEQSGLPDRLNELGVEPRDERGLIYELSRDDGTTLDRQQLGELGINWNSIGYVTTHPEDINKEVGQRRGVARITSKLGDVFFDASDNKNKWYACPSTMVAAYPQAGGGAGKWASY